MVGNMGADLDHGLAKDSEVDDELVEDADMDGGDAEVAVLGAITEDGFGASGHATESV
ncbi:hypothetical protein PHLCEN_2v1963 [Hermanssonia centrifuga]|nr:hypothetical protein PHLCEN_2v1963 [Hermanssonia centrifuga]